MGWDVVSAAAESHLAAMEKKKKNPRAARSWIQLDSAGKETVLDVDKHAIMDRVRIDARDLRILDPMLSYPSAIFGRERAILLNLEHIKVIITAEEVLLRDPREDNVVQVLQELQRRLPSPNHQVQGEGSEQHEIEAAVQEEEEEEEEFPFEFRALEVALEAICSYLDARTTELDTAARPVLDELTRKISSHNMDKMRKIKSSITRLCARIQKVRDEIEHLLDDDDDMADLYLSRKMAMELPLSSDPIVTDACPPSPNVCSKVSRNGKANDNNVEELEMLLEAYFMQIDGSYSKLTTLKKYVHDTEGYINLQLDKHRNCLIKLEVTMSAGTAVLSFYSLVAGVFGMNIPYTWNENHGYVFKYVVGGTGIVCFVAFVMIMAYARYKRLIGA